MERLLEEIRRRAKEVAEEAARFLSEIIRVQSLSGQEGAVVRRIAEEMTLVGLQDVHIDEFGNVLGSLGDGKETIAFDAHVDTVDAGERKHWDFEPFSGEIKDGFVFGRGASDQKGGMAAIVYAFKVLRAIGVPPPVRLVAVGSVQEEDCDGLCWQYIVGKRGFRPSCVVITEPTRCEVYRGHRGRMEIEISVEGLSAHGSAPERGINAIYRMADILKEVEALNERLASDPFLGKGSLTVSEIVSRAPSLCAVADYARIHIDRRLTKGETKESALAEISALPSVQKYAARVEVLRYDRPTHTGYVLPVEKYYPSWTIEEDHPVLLRAKRTFEMLFGRKCEPSRWTFSTNGVATAGIFGIPTIGFGPGDERFAHAPNERCEIAHLEAAVAFYAALALLWQDTSRDVKGR